MEIIEEAKSKINLSLNLTGKKENNFIKYEIKELSKLFKEIEIINHKSTSKNSILGKKLNEIRTNQSFSRQINIYNITKTFFFKTIFFICINKQFSKK